jgi:hypothetical protein
MCFLQYTGADDCILVRDYSDDEGDVKEARVFLTKEQIASIIASTKSLSLEKSVANYAGSDFLMDNLRISDVLKLCPTVWLNDEVQVPKLV